MNIDDASQKILRELQKDGRITVQDLAGKIGLSTSPCWRRLRDLEANGVIQRYTALLDRRKLGLDLCLIVNLSLIRHEEGVVAGFETRIRNCPEVIECYETSGDADYLIKVIVKDIEAFNNFLHNVLLKLPGVSQVRTSVTLREIKYDPALPV